MALNLIGKSASAIWSETAPADTSFMWMKIIDSVNPDVVIPHRYRDGKWSPFSSTNWIDSVLTIQSAPPISPSNGQRYIVGASASGDWATHEAKIATKTSAGWDFYVPDSGSSIAVLSEEKVYSYYSGTWLIMGGGIWGEVSGTLTDQTDLVAALQQVYDDAKFYADTVITGLFNDRGNYDASTNLFPSSGGSGPAGAIRKGDIWTISVSGVLGGNAVDPGDTVRAMIDTPGQTVGNWAITENNFGFTPENLVNKATTFGTVNHTLYPSVQAVNENFFRKVGNAYGANATLGLTDNFNLTVQTGVANLIFRTNGSDRYQISSAGDHLLTGTAGYNFMMNLTSATAGLSPHFVQRKTHSAFVSNMEMGRLEWQFDIAGSVSSYSEIIVETGSVTGRAINRFRTLDNGSMREYMSVYSTGVLPNVGIGGGVGVPSARLVVTGNGTGNTGELLKLDNSSAQPLMLVQNNGLIYHGNTISIASRVSIGTSGGGSTESNEGFSYVFRTRNNNNNQGHAHFWFVGGGSQQASSGGYLLRLTNTFAASSGSPSYAHLGLYPTYNTTGTFVGTAIGIDYDPTLTGVVGLTHLAARFNTGSVQINSGTLLVNSNDLSNGFLVSSTSVSGSIKVHVSAGNTGTIFFNQNGEFRYQQSSSASLNGSIRVSNFQSFILTSGTAAEFGIGSAFEPTSGTATYKTLLLNPTYNTTGTYVGTGIGVDYNPVLNGVTGLTHYAWRNTSGRFLINGTSTTYTGPLHVRENGSGQVAVIGNLEISVSGGTTSMGLGIQVAASNRTMQLFGSAILSASDASNFTFTTGSNNLRSSQDTSLITISSPWAPSSGTSIARYLSITSSVNPTGTYNGTLYGIDYNPNVISTTGLTHIAMRLLAGQVVIGNSAPVANTQLTVDRTQGVSYANIVRFTSSGNSVWNLTGSGVVTHTANFSDTSGSFEAYAFNGTFNPATGTSNYTSFRLNPTYNVGGGFTSGTVYGIDYNAVLTGMTNLTHIAIRTLTGQLVFGATSPAADTTLTVERTSVGFNTLVDFRNSGTSLWNLKATGAVAHAGSANITSGSFLFYDLTSTVNPSSGNGSFTAFRLQPTFAPTGTTTNGFYTTLRISPVYNFTVGTQAVYGIDYDPFQTGTTGMTLYGLLIRPANSFNGFGVGAAPTALLDVGASSASRSGFRLRPGPPPTAPGPNDGDIWIDSTAHTMHVRINGITKTFTLT
jgi:hypothetical protein